MPYQYEKSQFTVPSFGYHEEFSPTQVPHPEIYVLVDMSDLIEAEEGPVADGNLPDPNTPVHFVNGKNSSYPGITIAVGEDPFRFNPDADPNDYPFEIKDSNDLFTGTLYLMTSDDVLDWQLGRARSLKDLTGGDEWLAGWTADKIVDELIVGVLESVSLLGGYKSKGFGKVSIGVTETN